MSRQTGRDRRQPTGSPEKPFPGGPLPFVRANALEPFVSFLNEIGAPVERWLRQARVPVSLLDDPEALLPVFSAYRFVELAARREQMEEFGVVIGQRASSFDRGGYGAVLQGSSTVYEFLRIGTRLIGEHNSGARMWLKPEGGMIRVSQYLPGPPGPGRCIADLYTLVVTINTLRKILGPTWCPGEIRLLSGAEAFSGDPEIFGEAPIVTGQRHTSFTISRSLMQRPVPGSHARSLQAEDSLLAAGRPMPADFEASVEQLVVSLLNDGYPSIRTTADAAGMSLRTLQRRLAESGVTYTGLVSASRLRLARSWLTETDMPINEIATMLGYDEPTNFTRAFRRQTSISPSEYRSTKAQA
jgi:AraC-like DNA-binding protein